MGNPIQFFPNDLADHSRVQRFFAFVDQSTFRRQIAGVHPVFQIDI